MGIKYIPRKIGVHWGVYCPETEMFCCNVDTQPEASEILANEFNRDSKWAATFAWTTVSEELREQKTNWRGLLK